MPGVAGADAPTAPGRDVGRDSRRCLAARHWPIQLHLVPPTAPFFQGADVLLAADCVPFAVGDFHQRYLAGSSLAIACPKLDHNQEIYLEKLVAMIDTAEIASIHVDGHGGSLLQRARPPGGRGAEARIAAGADQLHGDRNRWRRPARTRARTDSGVKKRKIHPATRVQSAIGTGGFRFRVRFCRGDRRIEATTVPI